MKLGKNKYRGGTTRGSLVISGCWDIAVISAITVMTPRTYPIHKRGRRGISSNFNRRVGFSSPENCIGPRVVRLTAILNRCYHVQLASPKHSDSVARVIALA